jgi:hypothetical protein
MSSDSEEEYIRPPIASIKSKMLDNNNDFNEFKSTILNDDTIDDDMKRIMLQSRKEYIDNFNKKITFNNIIAEKSELFKTFSIKFNQLIHSNNILKEYKKNIENKINKYIDGEIKNIILDFEEYYEVINIIDTLEEVQKNKLLDVFKVRDEDEYNNYKMIIELSRKDFQDQENKKKIKEEEKLRRHEFLSTLINELKRLSNFDSDILILKNKLELSIEKYLNLQTDNIEIKSDDIFKDLIRFIKNNRACKNKYDEIIILCNE